MTINPEKIKPLGDRLLLHKCVNADPEDDNGRVLVVLPDMTRDTTNFCQVLASGPKCRVAVSYTHLTLPTIYSV